MMDTDKVRIQDDLYTYVNQEKLEELVIPDDQPSVGGFQTLAVDVEKIMINEFKEMCAKGVYPNHYLEKACTLFKIAKNAEIAVKMIVTINADFAVFFKSSSSLLTIKYPPTIT